MSSTGHLPELESLRSQVADLARELAERDQSMRAQSRHLEQTMQDLQEQSQLLRTIIEGTAAETGNEFFASLVTHLTTALNVRYAVIGEVLGEQSRTVRTLAVSAGGALVDNFEYALDYAPCGSGLTQSFWCFEHGVQERFPHFPNLAALGAESHCGVSLRDKAGMVVGLLIVMDTKPLRNSDRLKSLMEVFASRATAELQRYRAELAHRESEERFRAFLDRAPNLAFVKEPDGRYLYTNQRFEKAFGFSHRGALGKTDDELFPREQAAQFHRNDRRVLEAGEALEFEEVAVHADGPHTSIVVKFPLQNASGQIYAIGGIATDITERKRAEEALCKEKRHLVAAQALAHLGSWDWDIDSGEVQWSDEQFRIFGHEPGTMAVTYDTFLTSLHPEDHDRVLAAINNALIGKWPHDVECRIVRPSGEVRFIHFRSQVHRDATGHPLSMAGTVLDITERKQGEEALRVSEERWQLAVRGSNDGIWDWNIQTGDIFFSSRWKAMRGFENHEITNHVDEWRSRVHPDDLDRVLQSLDTYLARQTAEFYEEYRVQRKDGSYMWILGRGVALWADDGMPLRMAGSETDITERKRAEEAVMRSRDLMKSFVEHTPAAIAMLDRDLRYVAASHRWLQDYRLGSCDLVGRHHYDVFPEIRALEEWQAIHQRCLAGAVEQREEERFVREDGSENWLRWEVRPWRDVTDEIGGIIMFTEDITDRKRAEEALAESEERWKFSLEGSGDGVWDWNAQTNTVFYSSQWKTMLGYAEQEIGNTLAEWDSRVHPDDRDATYEALNKHFRGEVPIYVSEHRVRCKDGTWKWILDRGKVMSRTADGKPLRVVGTHTDITERKRAEDTLRRTQFSMDHAVDAIYWIDPQANILYANEAASAMLGYSLDELRAMTVHDLNPDFHAGMWPDFWAESRRRKSMAFETFHRAKSGQLIPIEIHVNHLAHEGHEFHCAFVRDITERKRAEEARAAAQAHLQSTVNKLRETNHTLTALIQSSPTAIVIIDLEGKTTLWNPAAAHIFGWQEEEVLGQPLPYIPPDRWEEHVRLRTAVLNGEPLTGVEVLRQRKDGSLVQIEVSTALLLDADNKPCGILGLLNDITGRKQAEEAVRVSEERFHLAVQGSNTGIWDWNLETNKCYLSPLWKSMLGYEEHELRGEFSEWEKRLHPDDRERSLATVRAYLNGTVPQYELEHRLRHKNGSYRWILARGVSISDAEGKPYRMAGSHIDITEQKQTQEALVHRERQLRIVLDTLPVGVWFTDHAGHVLLANPAARQIWNEVRKIGLGQDPEATGWWEHVGPTAEPHRWVLTRALMKGQSSLNETLQIDCHDGSRKTIRNSAVPVRDSDGKILGAIVLNEDITDRVRFEEALRRNHALLSAIMNAATDIIFVKDREGRYLHMNPAGARALDMTVEEVIGWNDYAVWPPDLAASCRAADQQVLSTGETVTVEELSTLGGKRSVYLTTKAPYRDESGTIIGIIGVSRDITERKHAEEALRASEERFAKAFRSSPDPVIIAELASGQVIDANDASYQLFGYRREDVEGRTTLDIGLWPSPEARARFIEHLERHGSVQNVEVCLRMKNGALRQCMLSSELIELHGKRCMVTVGRDITDQKRAEEALRESETRLTEAQRIAHIGSWELNLADKRLTWSDESFRIFEIDPQRFGASYEEFLELIHPHDRDLVNRAYLKSVANRTPFDIVHRLLLSDGRIKFVRERCETSYAEDGRPLRSIGTVQDITEQKHAEEALHQREQDLRDAMEERERISQDLHDGILQSLYAVGLGLESCKPLMRQRKHKQATVLLEQAIGQMNHVMAEVRNFIAGLESQVLQGGDFPTALRTMVQTLTTSQPIRCRLLIDERALRQVSTEQALHLLNVVREALSNSLRHGQATRATVSFKLLTRSIRLLVTDNGRGFHPDRAEGVGHGLANMAARAHRMGGRFAIHSRPTQGTRITVDLPKEEAYAHG